MQVDKNALYYPYIHFRDLNWLKATLLCFPQVSRMLPPELVYEENEIVNQFQGLKNHRGENLISEYPIGSWYGETELNKSQERLLKVLESNVESIKSKYSKSAVQQSNSETWVLHFEKIDPGLWHFLVENELAWDDETQNLNKPRYDHWVELHKKLGEAIMSFIAIQLAEEYGLDVVSDEQDIHYGLLTKDEKRVIADLLNDLRDSKPISETTKTNQLTSVLFATQFDMEQLKPSQIAELVKEGKDLRAFKDAITPIALTIDDIQDPATRYSKMVEKSEEVIELWRKYQNSLPGFAMKALHKSAKVKIPAWIAAGMGVSGNILHDAYASGLAIIF